MRFESLRIHKIGPFADVTLDLSAMPGKLIAVTGGNGEGKSTLLELLPGSVHRVCPTRGALVELATARDSFVETRVVNGAPYTIRLTADNVSKKAEGTVLQDGQPLIASAKVRELDAWVASHFPPPEVLYSSSFLAQGSEGFLELSAAERKRVLLRLLQIERYEAMAEQARERARDTRARWQTALARLEDTLAHYPRLENAEAQLREAEERLAEQTEAVRDARAQLDKLRQAQALIERSAARMSERAALEARIDEGRQAVDDLHARLRNNQTLLSREKEILAAAAASTAAATRAQELDREITAARVELATQTGRLDAARLRYERARQAVQDSLERVTELRARVDKANVYAAALQQLPEMEEAAKRAAAKSRELERQIKQLERLRLGAKDERINGLRSGLTVIASGSRRPDDEATRALLADDELARADKSRPRQWQALTKRHEKAEDERYEIEKKLSETRVLAGRAEELDSMRKRLDALQKKHDRALREAKDAAKDEPLAREALHAAKRALVELLEQRRQQTAIVEHPKFSKLAALAPALAQARARLEELQPQLDAAAAAVRKDMAALKQLPPIAAPAIDAPRVQRMVEATEAALALCQQRVALAKAAVAQAHKGRAELEARGAEAEALASDMTDWTRLANDLGRDGLQAMEIDAALPELTTLANDLLHSCHGSRFTIELRSDRLSADGRKTLEDLEVRVIDTEHGRDARGETYSGGERVIVSEALSLALTMVACRRAGLQRPTLVRDESGAALDPANGRAYIAMLRRAAEILDADKILFVAHQPELQELADARIVVAGGTATVQ